MRQTLCCCFINIIMKTYYAPGPLAVLGTGHKAALSDSTHLNFIFSMKLPGANS